LTVAGRENLRNPRDFVGSLWRTAASGLLTAAPPFYMICPDAHIMIAPGGQLCVVLLIVLHVVVSSESSESTTGSTVRYFNALQACTGEPSCEQAYDRARVTCRLPAKRRDAMRLRIQRAFSSSTGTKRCTVPSTSIATRHRAALPSMSGPLRMPVGMLAVQL